MHPLFCFQAPGKRSVAGSPVSKRSWFWNPFWFFVALLVGITGIVLLMSRPFLERDGEGNWKIAEWREEKLKRELEELNGAEQYALLASRRGWYICYSCPFKDSIFLFPGEVWKYGYTRKGGQRRYGSSELWERLSYVVQFEGSLSDCMKEEKRKIYNYPLLPEALKRPTILIRPPGNKIDN